MNTFNIHCGDSAEVLKQYPDNHFDSVVTDPPYGIDFLGKEWDSHTGTIELWKQVFRVLKPGGHLLAFSAPRTYHRLATNIEDVGFEIRDQIMWIYSSGFPKSQDVGRQIQKRMGVTETQPHKYGAPDNGVRADKEGGTYSQEGEQVICTAPEAQQWEGWKTALKPGHEPIVMARKPVKGSVVDNVLKHGTGAINIDATRIPFVDEADYDPNKKYIKSGTKGTRATMLNLSAESYANNPTKDEILQQWEENPLGRYPSNVVGDIPEYQKYFYSPKVSRNERHVGQSTKCTNTELAHHFGCKNIDGTDYNGSKDVWMPELGNIYSHGLITALESVHGTDAVEAARGSGVNNHPTVKPVELMKYLVRLVTPKGGTVLDPFNGSGSTGMAALAEGCNYVGCDLDENYVAIAEKRIAAYRDNGFKIKQSKEVNNFKNLFG